MRLQVSQYAYETMFCGVEWGRTLGAPNACSMPREHDEHMGVVG
jgi:hypothetical protein